MYSQWLIVFYFEIDTILYTAVSTSLTAVVLFKNAVYQMKIKCVKTERMSCPYISKIFLKICLNDFVVEK